MLMKLRRAGVVGFFMVSSALAGDAAHGVAPWFSDDGRFVEMRLAHRDFDRVDGGTLSIDRERRVLVWQGAPNEIGCRRPFEAPLDAVTEVALDEPGFRLRLSQGPVKEMKLIPLPHFAWLLAPKTRGGVGPNVREQLKGPDRDRMPIGGSGASTLPSGFGTAPPPEVRQASTLAVSAIRAALDHRP